jgi:hypothetical protein
VVTWEKSDFLAPGPQQTTAEVWVTVVPELRDRCRAEGFAPEPGETSLRRRLGQLLGLPPDVANDTLFEIWASPGDLRRPSADPDIEDDHCSLAFPANASAEHRAWIEGMRATQYGAADDPLSGYPWTQLGATYDWNPSSTDHRGPSQLVISVGAPIEVVETRSARDYGGG